MSPAITASSIKIFLSDVADFPIRNFNMADKETASSGRESKSTKEDEDFATTPRAEFSRTDNLVVLLIEFSNY